MLRFFPGSPSNSCWDALLKTRHVIWWRSVTAIHHRDEFSERLCNFSAGFKEALMNPKKRKWVRLALLYLSRWAALSTQEINFEDSRTINHAVNNPKWNYSALLPSHHGVVTQAQNRSYWHSAVKKVSFSCDPVSKPEELCQLCVRLPVWTLMSGNRTVHAETLMTELSWPQ